MIVLGFNDCSGNHYNSSVALVKDGKLIFAASEERYTRIKYDRAFPKNALQAALRFGGVELDEVDYFAVGYPPSAFYSDLFKRHWLDLPRSVLSLSPSGIFGLGKYLLPNFRKMYRPKTQKGGLKSLGVPLEKIIFIDHHLSHASSAYYCSGFDSCMTISLDGFGPNGHGRNVSGQVYRCENQKMELVEELPLHATMLWYSAVTVCLGLKFLDGEGKTMGLAAYGDPSRATAELREILFSHRDGQWQAYPYWIDMIYTPRKEVLLASRTGRLIRRLIKRYGRADVAAAAQRLLEETVIGWISHIHQRYPFKRLAVAGGTFLNVKLNKLIRENFDIDELFVHPHASDGGTAIGAALLVTNQKTGETAAGRLNDADLGESYSDADIAAALRTADDIVYEYLGDRLPEAVGDALTEGKVVGWFQGRAEWGPRALGRRSVLADPRRPETREMINSKMKNRDWFMPFAPSCLEEYGSSFFKDFCPSPFMTLAFDVYPDQARHIPAAIHVDRTARVHSVPKEHSLYYRVIHRFYERTGVPVILNTSFNRHGLPIVETPSEAIEHLLWGCVHELAIGGYLVRKRNGR
ncbi:MAG TPA: carbamoyltransferase C-terminal domain-containing protein [bacterium]|nr:carbamoyltransferase C-terminal domain-containing protein [bacterium]HPG45871.1 carbamoyltransferase C-terminal domain-containing protein [bacterium]HPM97902.1 carbamoyltransferase C-terminal domain-containing protein [bacterium]